jgi:hypothetical protein
MNGKAFRYFARVVAALSILVLGVLLLLNILTEVFDIEPRAIIDLQRYLVVEILVSFLAYTGPVSVMILWILMLYHWGTHEFKSRTLKKSWLAALLLGNIAISPIYYVVVVEMHRTLRDAGEKAD